MFSFGVVMHYLATGELPFPDQTIYLSPLPPLEKLRATEFSKDLKYVITKLLSLVSLSFFFLFLFFFFLYSFFFSSSLRLSFVTVSFLKNAAERPTVSEVLKMPKVEAARKAIESFFEHQDLVEVVEECSSSDVKVGEEAAVKLFDQIVVNPKVDDKKEHPYFEWMKMMGVLEKMHSSFKTCTLERGKRLIGLSMIDVDRECSCGEKSREIISWLRDNTSGSTTESDRDNTLNRFRTIIHRFFYILPPLFLFLLF
jgi:serine/threonine protein kinase